MSNSVNIPVEEILAEFSAWSEELSAEIANEVLRETRKNAQTAYDDRTRNLTKSIKKRRSKYGDKSDFVVGAFVPHAHLIEHGHRLVIGKDGRVVGHVAPHPFLEPAVEAVRNRLPQIINNVVGVPTVTVEK